ncbi:MAG: hypothetical protein NZ659_09425 [Acidimicrobiales bacterium]|nr:hypothetical protein [Acidimicrobiales bacterium]
MARGWESKAVESQQDEALRDRQRQSKRSLTATEKTAVTRNNMLELARARTLLDLEGATQPGHRAMLERALAALDEQLRPTKTNDDR